MECESKLKKMLNNNMLCETSLVKTVAKITSRNNQAVSLQSETQISTDVFHTFMAISKHKKFPVVFLLSLIN